MARGSVQKRILKDGKPSYLVRVEYDPDPVTGKRRQRSKAFPTKRVADARLTEWLSELDHGTAVDTSKMTVSEFLSHWLDVAAKPKVRATTLQGYKYTIDKYLIPRLGSVRVQALTTAQIDACLAGMMNDGIGVRTRQLCYTRLVQALAQGEIWGTVSRNVATRAQKPKSTPKQIEPWTAEQARLFLDKAANDYYAPLWQLAAATGARRGELLGLRWQDFDDVEGTVRIVQAVAVLKTKPVIQAPKSRAALRTITIPEEVVELLKAHRLAQQPIRERAGEAWADNNLIFCTGLGTPLNPSNVLRAFQRLLDAADVPNARLHDVRHMYASLRFKAGDPIHAIQRDLGHSRASMTLDVYGHLLEGERRRSANAIGAFLFEPLVTTETPPLAIQP